MAGAARIGALHVMLGLDSAQFTAGLAKARSGLGSFGKTAAVGLAAVATAAAAAGTAIAIAVKGSIDNADRMGEMAQAAGVSVEALTSLGYAAQMNGSDTEALASSFRKLSQNMLAVAQGGTSGAATAFNALGVSVTNADGQLRSADAVLLDVAERFAGMEDGALKTALAVQLFGKSGAELIPFLNQGREGIGALTAEADRLGITISGTTANAAGNFNDTLDRLNASMQGVVNKVTEAMLPALGRFAETLASPQFAESAAAIGAAIVQAMQMAVEAVNTVVGAFNALKSAMDWANTHDMFGNEIDRGNGAGKTFQPFNTEEQAKELLRQQLQSGASSGGDFYSGIYGSGGAAGLNQQLQQTGEVLTELSTSVEDLALGSAAAGGGVRNMTQGLAEASPAVETLRDQTNALDREWDSAFRNIGGGIRGLIDGSKSLNDILLDVAGSFAQLALQQFSNVGGGLGGIGSLLGGLLGFANGGSFQVGGAGGVDSQLVAFKASPNETVSVTKPGQERGGAMNVSISLDNAMLRAVVTDEAGRVVGQAAPAIVGTAVARSSKAAPSAIARYQNDVAGGDYRNG